MPEICLNATARQPVLKALANRDFNREVLEQALRLRGEDQARLFALARLQREKFFPQAEVEVRSVVEISNVCGQQCEYCGIGGDGSPKYVVTCDELLAVATHLYTQGRRVLLLQAGENRAQAWIDHVCQCVRGIKHRHADLALILCLGNLGVEQYRQLRAAGAERYILKFETSNPRLYTQFKPRDTLAERTACLEHLLALGFNVGSGNIVGLPGQSIADLVDDLLFAGRFPFAMISTSVFIPGEGSKLRHAPPGDADLTLNLLALLRILYPGRLIPTTSPLEKIKQDGQYLGLLAGANTVTIHDGTPDQLKKLFPIYSGRRFTPNSQHIHSIVERAGLRLVNQPLI